MNILSKLLVSSSLFSTPLSAALVIADFNDNTTGPLGSFTAGAGQGGGSGFDTGSTWENTGVIEVISGDLTAPASTNYGLSQGSTVGNHSVQNQTTFTRQTTLSPGAFLVLSSFTSGRLSNGGETIKLEDSDGSTIAEFSYSDSSPWPTAPDGTGPSLTFIGGDPNLPQSWRSSTAAGGSPGASDTVPFSAGDLLEYAVDSHRFDLSTQQLIVHRNSGADQAVIIPQWSTDLIHWHNSGFRYVDSEPSTWNFEATDDPRLFFRLKVESNR